MTKDVTIHINPPLQKGNLPILYYQYNIDGGLWRTVMPYKLPIVVRNLEINNTYNINIRAVNKDGASDSQTVEITPTGKPDPPTINNVIFDEDKIVISYTLGSDNGSDITDVEYRISGQGFKSAGLINPIEVTRGFRYGRNELIILRAKNKNGYSSLSNSNSIEIPVSPEIISFNAVGGNEQIIIDWEIDDKGNTLTNIEYLIEEI